MLDKLEETLTGICATGLFSINVEYAPYTVCPFDKVSRTVNDIFYNHGNYASSEWDETNKVLTLKEGSASNCGSYGKRKTAITFVCSHSSVFQNTASQVKQPSGCFYTVSWYTWLAC